MKARSPESSPPTRSFPTGDFRNDYFRGNRKQEVWDAVQAIVRRHRHNPRPTPHPRFALLPYAGGGLDRDPWNAKCSPRGRQRRRLRRRSAAAGNAARSFARTAGCATSGTENFHDSVLSIRSTQLLYGLAGSPFCTQSISACLPCCRASCATRRWASA